MPLLTGLMVLLFLRDWRSVIVVVLNIPFALLGALVALWLTGQTINLMTLGGLALAVGILVDEATVEVENIHTQMEQTSSMALAVWRGNAETAVPRLLAMLCILAVFIPSFFMEGAARDCSCRCRWPSASRWWPPTCCPARSCRCCRSGCCASATATPRRTASPLLRASSRTASRSTGCDTGMHDSSHSMVLRLRWLVLSAYLVVAVADHRAGRPAAGHGDLSHRGRRPVPAAPAAPAARASSGPRRSRAGAGRIIEEVARGTVDISVGYVGVSPSSYPINTIYLWMAGPEEAVLRVALKHGSGIRVEELKKPSAASPCRNSWATGCGRELAVGRNAGRPDRAPGARPAARRSSRPTSSTR